MAVKPLRLACVLAAALSLGSCQVLEFIFGSVFPATAVLLKGQVDLSGQIPPGAGYAFNLRVAESGGHGYVVLIGAPPGSSSATAYIYDLDLNLKSTQTGLAGSGVMVDAQGYIILGSRPLNPADLSPATASISPQVVGFYGNLGVDGAVQGTGTSAYNEYDFTVNGAVVSNALDSYNWASSSSAPSQSAISTQYSSLQMFGLFDDGNPAGNLVLVMGPQGGGSNVTVYFISLPKTDFTTSAYPAGVMDTSANRNDLEQGSFGYAQGSIFAYDNDSSSFVKINPATGSIQSSIYAGQSSGQTRYAYRIGGGSFYGFDTNARVLTRYTQWW